MCLEEQRKENKSSCALKCGRDVELFFNEKQYHQKLQLLLWVSLIFFTLMQNQMQMVGTFTGNFFKADVQYQ